MKWESENQRPPFTLVTLYGLKTFWLSAEQWPERTGEENLRNSARKRVPVLLFTVGMTSLVWGVESSFVLMKVCLLSLIFTLALLMWS